MDKPIQIEVRIPAEGLPLKSAISNIEAILINEALDFCGQNRAAAAARLGLNRTTLVEKLRRVRDRDDSVVQTSGTSRAPEARVGGGIPRTMMEWYRACRADGRMTAEEAWNAAANALCARARVRGGLWEQAAIDQAELALELEPA